MSQAELCGLAMHLQYRVPCPTSNALSSRFCSRSWFPLVKKSSDVTLGSWGCSCRALSMASKAWGGVGGSSVRKAHEGSCVLAQAGVPPGPEHDLPNRRHCLPLISSWTLGWRLCDMAWMGELIRSSTGPPCSPLGLLRVSCGNHSPHTGYTGTWL